MTTLDEYPDVVADAIRDMVDIDLDREVPGLRIIDYVLRQFDPPEARRMLEWAWDRYVEQPKRDAIKAAREEFELAALSKKERDDE